MAWLGLAAAYFLSISYLTSWLYGQVQQLDIPVKAMLMDYLAGMTLCKIQIFMV